MRYLYGDSVPFPLGLDFLKTIDAFVTGAARVVRLEAELADLEAHLEQAHAARSQALEGLERFHRTVMHTLRESSMRSMDAATLDYARVITDTAVRFVDEATRAANGATEHDRRSLRPEIDRRRSEQRVALEAFFVAAPLPVLDDRLSLDLAPDAITGGVEPTNQLRATLGYPANIAVEFALAEGAVDEWRHPRRVSEFARGLDLLVGARKSWFKKTVERDIVHLDEMFLGGFVLGTDVAEIRVRKRPEAPDSLVFRLARRDEQLFAEVLHPDVPEADDQLTRALESHDRANVERLWQMLRHASMRVVPFRTRVLGVTVDGLDPFEAGASRVVGLVERLVALLAPTVQEIDRRSPSPDELSLKIEREDGSREELYLKKAALIARLAEVPAEARSLLLPLGLRVPDNHDQEEKVPRSNLGAV